jgi:hypothetical protein
MRVYRHGSTEKKRSAKTLLHSNGYVMVPASGHVLAHGSSHAYEHRLVYHKHHGDGPFNCHWCGCAVTWGDLHIDHLDDNKTNNAVANLAATCPPCNMKRGQTKARNTWRSKIGVSALGMSKTMNEWAEYAGISRNSIIARLKRGMSFEDAVTKPRGKFGPK